jgi:diacylglycerol O-acyltransferase
MAEPRRLDYLTAQDLLMLWPDEFGWSQDIGALAILDGTRLLDPDGRIRIETIRRQLEPRLLLVHRIWLVAGGFPIG